MSIQRTIRRERQPKQEKRREPEGTPKSEKRQLKQTPSGSCDINPKKRRPRSSESCESVGISIDQNIRDKTIVPPSIHIKREAPMHAREHSTDYARPSEISNSSCEHVRKPTRDGVRLRSGTRSPAGHRQYIKEKRPLKKLMSFESDITTQSKDGTKDIPAIRAEKKALQAAVRKQLKFSVVHQTIKTIDDVMQMSDTQDRLDAIVECVENLPDTFRIAYKISVSISAENVDNTMTILLEAMHATALEMDDAIDLAAQKAKHFQPLIHVKTRDI